MKKIIYLFILIIPLFSCNQKENTTENNGNSNSNNNGQNATNEQRMKEFYDQVINAHNTAMIDSFVTADFREHQPWPGKSADREGLKSGFSEMMTAFPDLTCSMSSVKSWGDTVMATFTMKGTNTGSYMGAPATNKQISIEGVDFVKIKDGKATEHWGYLEQMKMMNQLGMGPGSGPPPAENK